MKKTDTRTSSVWVESLARSDAELARGDLVPAQAVHDELRQTLAEMEGETAEANNGQGPPAR